MKDNFGRNINYLRLSLTQRCQLHCTYCSKAEGKCLKDRELDTSSILFAAKEFSNSGFDKIRLTGGEPLLRKDIVAVVSGIKAIGAYKDISLTTNGQKLFELGDELKKAGLSRCNISIDSLNEVTYKKITGASLAQTLTGIEKAQRIFGNVKLNVVLMKGINDNEIDDFISLAKDNPFTVRFIELMPLGDSGEGISNKDILLSHKELEKCENEKNSPAVLYKGKGFKGTIGFINPISSPFCADCNRMRMTYDGFLRPCLGNNEEIDARQVILEKNSAEFKKLIELAVMKKAEKGFGCSFKAERKMNAIGG